MLQKNITFAVMNQAFTIEISSDSADWRLYNIRIMCELQDDSGLRTGFASTTCKADAQPARLTTLPCRRLRIFVYVIPESLPADRTIKNHPDFDAVLLVRCGNRTIARESIEVNRWGGASIERMYDSQGEMK